MMHDFCSAESWTTPQDFEALKCRIVPLGRDEPRVYMTSPFTLFEH